MDLSLWASFVLASTLIELTPGPNMAYLAVIAAADGRRAGLATVAGVALGLAVIGLLAAFGLGAAIAASPVLYQGLRWAGVAWLFYLAWDGWRDAAEVSEFAEVGSHLSTHFKRGLITNLLNPKAAVFYVAVLPGFVTATANVTVQTVTLSLTFVAVATAIHVSIVLLAGSARRLLSDPARARIIRRVLASSLAVVAVWFAWRT